MVEEKEIIIREFQPGDLRQVAEVLASSFKEELQKLTNLPEERILVTLT